MKERILYLDNAKAIGILLVIVGHTKIAADTMLYNIIYSFHMPLFIIISGMFIKGLSPKEALKKYSTKILPPLICSLIIIFIGIMLLNVYFWNLNVFYDYLHDFFRRCLYFDLENTSMEDRKLIGPLWFLYSLFWASILFSILKNKYNDFHLGILCLGIFFISCVGSEYFCLPLYIFQGGG